MLPLKVLYDGSESAPAEPVELQAGPLSMVYDQGDLRYIRFGSIEILRRIYIAVRDSNWLTVPSVLSNVQMKIGKDTFLITYTADHCQGEINFHWNGEIRGSPDGIITFSMSGIARSTFWRNRIGFCVLHPANLAGCKAEVLHIDGSLENTVFPIDFVSDQPVIPFKELKQVSHEFLPGQWSEVEFSGDIFEMEDQRNWTDASYKIFCTPLSMPYPVEIQEGTKITQSITLRIKENSPVRIPKIRQGQEKTSTETVLVVDRSGPEIPIPSIGLGIASHGQLLNSDEIARLKALHLAYLRVDLPLSDPLFESRLQQAIHEVDMLGIGLEVAILVSENANQEFEKLRETLDYLHPPVIALLCYPSVESLSMNPRIESIVTACRRLIGDSYPSIPIVAGTNSDLLFLHRTIPPLDQIQGVCFAICPQIHAFDNASLIETLEVQGSAVESAQRVSKNLPVRVSPVTFKMRFNPYATAPAPALQPGEMPAQVDVRQMSLFSAAWTVGSFKYTAEAGVQSITYYETTGWRGVMETAQGSPLPGVFHSHPGTVFPVYHVLADIGDFAGGSVIPVRSSNPLQGIGFLLRKSGRERMVVANVSRHPQRIQIRGLVGQVSARMLDETNAFQSMKFPEEYRKDIVTKN